MENEATGPGGQRAGVSCSKITPLSSRSRARPWGRLPSVPGALLGSLTAGCGLRPNPGCTSVQDADVTGTASRPAAPSVCLPGGHRVPSQTLCPHHSLSTSLLSAQEADPEGSLRENARAGRSKAWLRTSASREPVDAHGRNSMTSPSRPPPVHTVPGHVHGPELTADGPGRHRQFLPPQKSTLLFS